MPSSTDVPDPPGHLLALIDQLRNHGFTEVDASYDAQVFGNAARVLERPPIKVRIVRDRGEWSAEFTGEGWPPREGFGEEWVWLPPTISQNA